LADVGEFIHQSLGHPPGHPLLVVVHIDETQTALSVGGEEFFMEMIFVLYQAMTRGSKEVVKNR